jgi:hypothetical protein
VGLESKELCWFVTQVLNPREEIKMTPTEPQETEHGEQDPDEAEGTIHPGDVDVEEETASGPEE